MSEARKRTKKKQRKQAQSAQDKARLEMISKWFPGRDPNTITAEDMFDLQPKMLDEKFGEGKWHCDDLVDSCTLPECVHQFVEIERMDLLYKHENFGTDYKAKPCYATYKGKRVRLVMASRMGDVGITPNLDAERGYSERVYIPELSEFSYEKEYKEEAV